MLDWLPIFIAAVLAALTIQRLFRLGGKEADVPRTQLGLVAIVLVTASIFALGQPILSAGLIAALSLLLGVVWQLSAVTARLGALKRRLQDLSLQLEETSETASSAIQSSQRRFKELARIAPVGIFAIDARGGLNFMSHRWHEITGLKQTAGQQQTFLGAVHPEDKPDVEAALLQMMLNQSRFEEAFRFLHEDGKIVWAAVVAVPIMSDELGRPAEFVGTALDVTELRARELERRRLRERVERAERMESFGKLAGGIAHDLNNLLVPVLGHAEGLLRTFGNRGSERPRAEQIRTAALRASELVTRMLSYAGAGHGEHRRVDLRAIYSDLRRIIDESAAGKAQLEIVLDDESLPVQGDPMRIAKVFQSAFQSALDAMAEQPGTIGIRLGLTALGPREIEALVVGESISPGAYALFEVSDQGTGFDFERATQVFDPLMTSAFEEANDELLQVGGLARTMKGGIGLRPNDPVGKVLSLYLPIATAAPAPNPLFMNPTNDQKCERLLLIDDDDAVRTTLRLTLEDRGYEIIEANNGLVGIKIIGERRSDLSAVLLDLTMPLMDGEAVFEWLRINAPDLPVLFLSGYGERELVMRLTKNTKTTAFLRKPFVSQELYDTIDALLLSARIKP